MPRTLGIVLNSAARSWWLRWLPRLFATPGELDIELMENAKALEAASHALKCREGRPPGRITPTR